MGDASGMRALLAWMLSILLVVDLLASGEDFRREVRLIRRVYLDVTGLVPTETEIDWFLVYERTGYPLAVEFLMKEGPRGGFTREVLLSEEYRRQEERELSREELERNVAYLAGKFRGGVSESSFEEAAVKFIENALLVGEGRVGESINYLVQGLVCRPCTAEEETRLTRIFNQVSLKSEELAAYKTVLLHVMEMHDCKFK
jgi:hypothetical protein